MFTIGTSVTYNDDCENNYRGVIVAILDRSRYNLVVQWEGMPEGVTVEYNSDDLRMHTCKPKNTR